MADYEITPEMMDRYRKVGVAAVYSAVLQLGYRHCYMQDVQGFSPGRRLVGRAKTLRYIPTRPDIVDETVKGESSPEYQAMGSCGPGDVLVVEAAGQKWAAIGGDIVLMHLKMVGAEGVITDGGVRDIRDVLSHGFALFAGGETPSARQPYLVSHSHNIDISCGGISVRPGDLMVAEDESIVCVPRHLVHEVIDWVEEHEAAEEVIRAKILEEQVPPGKHYNPENFERVKKELRAKRG